MGDGAQQEQEQRQQQEQPSGCWVWVPTEPGQWAGPLAGKLGEIDAAIYVFRDALASLQTDNANLRADLEVARGLAWIGLQASPEAQYILGLHDENAFRTAARMQQLDDYQTQRAVALYLQTLEQLKQHRTHSLPALLARLAHDTGLQFQRLCTPACWSWKTAAGVVALSLATFYLAAM